MRWLSGGKISAAFLGSHLIAGARRVPASPDVGGEIIPGEAIQRFSITAVTPALWHRRRAKVALRARARAKDRIQPLGLVRGSIRARQGSPVNIACSPERTGTYADVINKCSQVFTADGGFR